MSKPLPPSPAKLLVSIFASKEDLIEASLQRLEECLGPHDLKSSVFPFDKTDYYEEEFGPRLIRRFVAFKELIEQTHIIAIKHLAYKIEKDFSLEGRRRVNIDPGYILLERLVLVTFKNFSHRLYLGQGVYGEVTLLFKRGSFQTLPWTYPDYAQKESLEFFLKVREQYKKDLKKWRNLHVN